MKRGIRENDKHEMSKHTIYNRRKDIERQDLCACSKRTRERQSDEQTNKQKERKKERKEIKKERKKIKKERNK